MLYYAFGMSIRSKFVKHNAWNYSSRWGTVAKKCVLMGPRSVVHKSTKGLARLLGVGLLL